MILPTVYLILIIYFLGPKIYKYLNLNQASTKTKEDNTTSKLQDWLSFAQYKLRWKDTLFYQSKDNMTRQLSWIGINLSYLYCLSRLEMY